MFKNTIYHKQYSKFMDKHRKMEDDEETIDYIDFTVITDVERFIVALEAVLHEWQLTAGSKYQKKPMRKVHCYIWSTDIMQICIAGCFATM
jgi:hypothetical protein